MANRKGVVSVNKWATSDGQEFGSANEANDYQGALNEIDRDGGGFESWFYSKDRNPSIPAHIKLDPEHPIPVEADHLKAILFAWEHFKNSHAARANDLFPEKESGVSEPETGSTVPDQKPSIAMEKPETDPEPKSDDKNDDTDTEKGKIKKHLKL